MKLRWTFLLAALVLGLGMIVAVACGGGNGDEDEEEAAPRPAATAVAEETAVAEPTEEVDADGAEEEDAVEEEDGGAVTSPGAAFAELDSFRYTVRFSVEGGDAAEGSFAFDVEGAYVAPDSHQVLITGNIGGLTLDEESITIGGKSWVRSNGSWTEGGASFATGEFSPSTLFEGFSARDFRLLKPTSETVNGVPSLRYDIGRADLEQLGQLGALFGSEADLADLPEDFDISIWVAEDGEWPVRMTMSASGDVEGTFVSFDFSMDVTDVNDSSISIEPPI